MLERAKRLLRGQQAGAELHWLNNDLAIGRVSRSEDWAAAYEAGVRAVIDLQSPTTGVGSVVRDNGMRYLRLCSPAAGIPSPEELQIVAGWAIERMQDGKVLFRDGNDRFNDGLAATATLIKSGLPAHLALLALRRARPDSSLDHDQAGTLVRFAALQPVDESDRSETKR